MFSSIAFGFRGVRGEIAIFRRKDEKSLKTSLFYASKLTCKASIVER